MRKCVCVCILQCLVVRATKKQISTRDTLRPYIEIIEHEMLTAAPKDLYRSRHISDDFAEVHADDLDYATDVGRLASLRKRVQGAIVGLEGRDSSLRFPGVTHCSCFVRAFTWKTLWPLHPCKKFIHVLFGMVKCFWEFLLMGYVGLYYVRACSPYITTGRQTPHVLTSNEHKPVIFLKVQVVAVYSIFLSNLVGTPFCSCKGPLSSANLQSSRAFRNLFKTAEQGAQ